MDKQNLLSLDAQGMSEFVASMGEPPYRTKQLLSWIYDKKVLKFDDMANLPAHLQAKLNEKALVGELRIAGKQYSADGSKKFLFALAEGHSVETVLLPARNGYTVCISTQAGCRMGCLFCASGQGGLVRNLTAAEMMEQVLQASSYTSADKNIKGIVLMGTGEPLDNWEQTCLFLDAVNDPQRLGMSLRNVTLSTCGIVPAIYKLAQLKSQLTLSVSLHAPDDNLRNELMPVTRAYPLDKLIKACHHYVTFTGRRVSFEYLLASGINDSLAQAFKLAALLRGGNFHVNLLQLNKVQGLNMKPSSPQQVRIFAETLKKRGINVTVRRSLGDDIDAACGQLRNRLKDARESE